MKQSMSAIIYKALLSRSLYLPLYYVSHSYLAHYDKSATMSYYKWDSVFFKNIIENGYGAEHHLAFFPLLPLVYRHMYRFLYNDFIITNLLFCINAILLYKISLYFYSYDIAYMSLYFFLYNPCSIIMSCLYTETLFMTLFLLLVYQLINKRYVHASVMISLACLCRSNGILLVIFYDCVYFNLTSPVSYTDLDSTVPCKRLHSFSSLHIVRTIAARCAKTVLHILIVCLPISMYQLYSLSKILSISHNSCTGSVHSLVYVPYSYIQKKYWNQGLFKFYTTNNLPNLFIGLPFIVFCTCICYQNIQVYCNNKKVYKKMNCLLFIQIVMSLLFLHLNMFFRFVSYNPIIYITMSHIYKCKRRLYIYRLFVRYYLAFSVAYAILHGAFYPPA